MIVSVVYLFMCVELLHECISSSIATTVFVYVCAPIIVIVSDDAFVGSRDQTVGIAQ